MKMKSNLILLSTALTLAACGEAKKDVEEAKGATKDAVQSAREQISSSTSDFKVEAQKKFDEYDKKFTDFKNRMNQTKNSTVDRDLDALAQKRKDIQAQFEEWNKTTNEDQKKTLRTNLQKNFDELNDHLKNISDKEETVEKFETQLHNDREMISQIPSNDSHLASLKKRGALLQDQVNQLKSAPLDQWSDQSKPIKDSLDQFGKDVSALVPQH